MLRYRLVMGLVSGRSGRRVGQARSDGWSVDSRWGICRQSQNEGCRQSAYFAEVLFQFLADFSPIWSVSVIFETRFFRFSLFFNFQIRYTRSENPRLMYSSSPTRVKAPQLGLKGSRFVQTVDWGLNPWFSLLESSLSTHRRCSRDSWDPLLVLATRVREGGDSTHFFPLFSLYFGLPSL
jgi:hypothetical protein